MKLIVTISKVANTPDQRVTQSNVDSGMKANLTINGKKTSLKIYSNVSEKGCSSFIIIKGKRHYLHNDHSHATSSINRLINLSEWYVEINED